MPNTTTTQLLAALQVLQSIHPTAAGEEITAIQFEDGSGYKFNYQVNCGPWQFIDLTLFM